MFGGGNRVHPAPPDSVHVGPGGARVPGGVGEEAARAPGEIREESAAWAPPVGAERMEAGGELYIPFTVAKAKVHTDLEATQGQNASFFSQLPHKCHLEEVASVED